MKTQSRSGVTIIELLVSLGVVGLLLSILVPAVQQARESSRTMQCRNNLRQIGLAMTNIVESDGKFPTSSQPEPTHHRLLPYLDAAPLAAVLKEGKDPDSWVVPTFACPSDPVVHVNMAKIGDSSYYLNHGTLFDDSPGAFNGFYSDEFSDTAPRDITDGLSLTVAASERLVKPLVNQVIEEADLQKQPRRFFWWTETRYGVSQEASAVENCKNHRTVMAPQPFGINVIAYQAAFGYQHLLTPNSPSCFNGPEDFSIDFSLALIAASSLHHGGVNSLFADGSVHFISDSIDETVWQSLGSRNGNETISEF
ncbi:DUF1559 family PulG-like putative transporter [Thalassoglobus polymorphus]|uniref:DUF1559 domain-containing protein n=1 Tax=Thalassoglobus polymorphus TaxID=2527994 RepID=A0A517QII8_9PLAN|nr:DUF1559 domain-containing protein [Thalassoglobus polymorphus]QDT31424.1 hypothetical protein Mal48_06570 [Thalassoglobus polymorphus]